ncbi:claudin 10-like 2 isoform X1 [Paramormyrops kingsleyae]|uniref:claudin 10-like 2 isoform X1 n=1 Tax=Paramormyrops kingsleyae TaxID=1676925 RepID=UPI000CD63243|nr:claudin-10-like isoform X1 [Paramormyrops kingsleyae]
MKKRLIQISGFLLSTLGWLFVSCTMAMDSWKESQLGGLGGSYVIKVAWYWSNLWKDCFVDSTAVTNCRDYGVLWSVTPYIQGVRGLLMGGLAFGFCGVILAFVGMECTYIGGSQRTNNKVLFAAAVFHFLGGALDTAGYCLYINRIAITAYNPKLDPTALRYSLGTPIFLGLVGSFLIIGGSILYAIAVMKSLFPEKSKFYNSRPYTNQQSRSRTLYAGYYGQSRQSQSRLSRHSMKSGVSKSSQVSTISQIEDRKISERDAFV